MSKNITIQEGGTDKQMTVNKLKTDTVGGGTCLWVPEEEVALGTKSISQNGTYKASDDGKYGFSQVTVNVSGGQGSVNSDGTPNVNPIDPNDPDSKVNPGGPGTSVVGTDPVTGNDYIIGVDGDGELVTTPVPSVIEITELPDKTDYTSGDSVDPSGLVAVLKNNDGTTFTNEDYPDGKIPISELTFPTTSAEYDESTASGNTSDLVTNIPQPIATTKTIICTKNDKFEQYDLITGYGIVEGNNGYSLEVHMCVSQEDYPIEIRMTREDGTEFTYNAWTDKTFTYDGKTVRYITTSTSPYFNPGAHLGRDYKVTPSPIGIPMDGPSAWTIAYGQPTGSTQQLPVQWKSPYDGRTLETSYQVTVDGSGFSDDSGGSESGGGTDIPGGGSSSDSGGSSSGGGGNF